jgi:hypothetical protein
MTPATICGRAPPRRAVRSFMAWFVRVGLNIRESVYD